MVLDLNTQRANDEANGIIHWLRPDYQDPSAISEQTQIQGELETTADDDATVKIKPAAKQTWPKEMRSGKLPSFDSIDDLMACLEVMKQLWDVLSVLLE